MSAIPTRALSFIRIRGKRFLVFSPVHPSIVIGSGIVESSSVSSMTGPPASAVLEERGAVPISGEP